MQKTHILGSGNGLIIYQTCSVFYVIIPMRLMYMPPTGL
jgi:hypothetical protein